MTNQKGSISIHTENIFPIIKKWLYSDHDIFYRELVSNCCDAVTKLKKLSLMSEVELDENEELESLEDLEELVLYRNVLRSFAKDIPVGPFEKTSPAKEQTTSSNEEMHVGEEEL